VVSLKPIPTKLGARPGSTEEQIDENQTTEESDRNVKESSPEL